MGKCEVATTCHKTMEMRLEVEEQDKGYTGQKE